MLPIDKTEWKEVESPVPRSGQEFRTAFHGTSCFRLVPARLQAKGACLFVVLQIKVGTSLGVSTAILKCPSWCVWNQDPYPSLLCLTLQTPLPGRLWDLTRKGEREQVRESQARE